MGRAPCCEKIGLKKGPWTQEEDEILTSYINKHGHANWRALPKHAGLLRCGKSCRLRWINYLRPDIKRGNFSSEEEDIIIKMHELLGNRWSAIAAKLPGRTDNEIKNVWHTHIKKKLEKTNNQPSKRVSKSKINRSYSNSSTITTSTSNSTFSSDFSSQEKIMDNNIINEEEEENPNSETMPEIDESFWSEALTDDECSNHKPSNELSLPNHQYSVENFQHQESYDNNSSNYFDDGMDFWYDVFLKSGESIELPEFGIISSTYAHY